MGLQARQCVPHTPDQIRKLHPKLSQDVKRVIEDTPGATEEYILRHIPHRISKPEFHAWFLNFWAHQDRFGAIRSSSRHGVVQFFLPEASDSALYQLQDLVNLDSLRVIRYLETKATPQEAKAIREGPPGLTLGKSQVQELLDAMCQDQLIAQVKNPRPGTKAFAYQLTKRGQGHGQTDYARDLVPPNRDASPPVAGAPCPCLHSKRNQQYRPPI